MNKTCFIKEIVLIRISKNSDYSNPFENSSFSNLHLQIKNGKLKYLTEVQSGNTIDKSLSFRKLTK